MRLSTKLSGIVAVGGVAALGAGLISSGGIGAEFHDSAIATADINVGTFGCELSSTDSNVVIENPDGPDGVSTATIDFGTITSSAPASRTAPLTLTNAGSIPLKATWTFTGDSTSVFKAIGPALDADNAVYVAPNGETTFTVGAEWQELSNTDLRQDVHMAWTVACAEQDANATNVSLDTSFGGKIVSDESGNYVITSPGAIVLNGVSGNLPTEEPSFTSDLHDSALPSPEFDIRFDNGNQLIGWATGKWMISGVTFNGQDWTTATTNQAISNAKVVSVHVLAGGTGVNYTISCINYDSTNYVGSGVCW